MDGNRDSQPISMSDNELRQSHETGAAIELQIVDSDHYLARLSDRSAQLDELPLHNPQTGPSGRLMPFGRFFLMRCLACDYTRRSIIASLGLLRGGTTLSCLEAGTFPPHSL